MSADNKMDAFVERSIRDAVAEVVDQIAQDIYSLREDWLLRKDHDGARTLDLLARLIVDRYMPEPAE